MQSTRPFLSRLARNSTQIIRRGLSDAAKEAPKRYTFNGHAPHDDVGFYWQIEAPPRLQVVETKPSPASKRLKDCLDGYPVSGSSVRSHFPAENTKTSEEENKILPYNKY